MQRMIDLRLQLGTLAFTGFFNLFGLEFNASALNVDEDHSGTWAIIGDAGVWNDQAQLVRDSIRRADVSQLILPGDNLYFGTYESVWSHWSGFTFPLVAIGNHHDGYAKELAYFGLSSDHYSQSFGETLFLVLNSDREEGIHEQLSWLRTQLVGAEGRSVILIQHHPPYTISNFHHWREKRLFQKGLRSLVHEFRDRIRALIVGHDHIAALENVGGVPMIVSGAIWQTRASRNNDYVASDGMSVKTVWRYNDRDPYWVQLKLSDQGATAVASFIRAQDDLVSCVVKIAPSYEVVAGCER